MKTREEHLAWCKERALEYLKDGDITNAIISMASDLNKHPETKPGNDTLLRLGMMHVANCDLGGARRWIEGWR
jgi:hypothetical protein